jgi:hypothetical protein
VILKRFATDLRVLLRAIGFGIRGRKIIAAAGITNTFHRALASSEAPNPKHQARKKFQSSRSRLKTRNLSLDIETWSFIEIWNLEFGAFVASGSWRTFLP